MFASPPHPASKRGFTMIELMVVVGIMGIVLAMGIPSIYRTLRKDSLTQAIKDIVEVCSNGRARAILGGSVNEVVFNGMEGTIVVGAAVQPAEGLPNAGAENFSTPPPRPGSGLGMKLPETVAISKLYVNGLNAIEMSQVRVRFFPNGTCDDLVLQLRSDKNEMAEITLELTTGLAIVKHNSAEFRLR